MEKVVKSEYDETKVKQEMDIKSEYVENGYSLCERSEPVSLVIHPMQINTQNTRQPEDYFFEDVVKFGYDESERKHDISSIDFSEYTEDNNSAAEPTSKRVSLEVDSVQIHIKYTSPGEKLVKSEYDKIERKEEVSSVNFKSESFTGNKYALTETTNYPITLVTESIQNDTQNVYAFENYSVERIVKSECDAIKHKQEAASSDVRSTYTEDYVSKPTHEVTSLVDSFSSTFQINTQHPVSSEEYVVKHAVKSEYDAIEFKQENSSIDLESEVFTEDKYALIEGTSEPVSLVIHSMQGNTQNTSQPEDYFYEDVVKYGYNERERKQEVSSIDIPECTEDKYSVAEPTSKPVSLEVNSDQIHIKGTSLAEDYFDKKLIKYEYDGIERKQEAASPDVRSPYTEDSVSKPTNELTSLVDSFSSTFQIKTQHPDWSEEYVVKDEVKSEYDETEFKLENSSNDLESEVFTEDKNSLIEATSDPVSLVMDSVQINTKNIGTSEENIFETTVKSQYDEVDHKQQVSSNYLKLEYTQDKYAVADPKNGPVSLVGQNSTCQINTQNADSCEDYNIDNVSDAIQRLDKSVSREISEISSLRGNLKPQQLTRTGEKLFSCDVCSKAFSLKGGLKKHTFTHTGDKFFCCDICSKAFSWRCDLKRHMFTHTGEKFFPCDVCSKTFSRRSNLKRHMFTHTGEKFFACDVCSKTFFLKDDLEKHTFTHTRDTFFSCDICSKTFSFKSVHKRHMLTHTGDKFFSCDICSKAFSWRSDLKRHMFTHTGEKFFSCDVCSKAFSRRSNLKRHMFTHTGEKFFACDVCSKSFSLKGNLEKHTVTHTRDKFFSCDICSKTFSFKSVHKRHMLTHTGDKFFSCDICSKAFSWRSDLKRHTFTHTGDKFFSCDICSKAFSFRSDLKRHMFTHTGEKFFSCDVCSKAFSRRSHVKRHMFTHTGEKFFSCDVCSKSFTQKSNLKAHLITHKPTGDV